jgi:hypothetical protein
MLQLFILGAMNLYAPTIKRKLFAVFFLWSLIIFMPGAYSVDSFSYVYEFSHNHSYTDWHPPMLAFVWKVLRKLTGYYESLYVAQMTLYWYMGYVLATRVAKTAIAFWLTLALLILFQFMPQYVMKDTHAALCWGFAAVLMTERAQDGADGRRRVGLDILIFLLLMYGFLVRINAFVALAPLLILFCRQTFPRLQKPWKKAMLIVGITCGLFIANNIITYKLFNAQRAYPEYKLMLLDITGISKITGKNYLPAEVTEYPAFNMDTLMAEYTAATFDHIYWPDSGTSIVPMPTATIAAATTTAWKNAILQHPAAYLQNRMHGFLYYLRIKHRFPNGKYWNVKLDIEKENPIHVYKPEHSHSYRFAMGSFSDIFFFDPWLWLLLNTVMAIYFYSRYKRMGFAGYSAMALIQLSGVLYMLSQFPVYQHDRDFRYNYWNVVVFIIGIVYLVGKPAVIQKEPEPKD